VPLRLRQKIQKMPWRKCLGRQSSRVCRFTAICEACQFRQFRSYE
jgi:hypothetical protein